MDDSGGLVPLQVTIGSLLENGPKDPILILINRIEAPVTKVAGKKRKSGISVSETGVYITMFNLLK